MNVLMMSLMYPEDMADEVRRNAKDKLQNQINSYQRAFVEGIRENLHPGEDFQILNALPVGVFPFQYRKLRIPAGLHDENSIYELGCINLPWLKRRMRMKRATRYIMRWAKQSPQNRTVLLYTLYLPFMQAIDRVKRHFPDMKACVIVTDLPNELGLSSGRKGLLKRLEYLWGSDSIALCQRMDGFVLLTEPMASALKVREKPFAIIEGLICADAPSEDSVHQSAEPTRKTALYTGTLEPDLGIQDLLSAFETMPEYDLWICGQGSMSEAARAAASRCENIRYFGFVPQQEALRLQAMATVLINPRSASGVFTRYSFPSKTLEYMRTGKPVLCYKLEGIPDEYDGYLCYIRQAGAQGIASAIRELFSRSPQALAALGEAARTFVLENKNPATQCKKLIKLLRSL
ncbi:MAG: glycosyltransferase [Clostridiales bacterium]|nr:glycosyltransferase [Clostridiales bacterium]MDO4349981.1 glycosyltransferase [Eubacteriales bacterium]MDY4009662.1 glycosyltransferase [Candidatus Limiplasma sp.]